jgi:hypothetical protein
MSTAFQTDGFQSDAWQILAGTGEAPVTVPNVVGQTQEDGTTTVEAEGLVIAVVTAVSSQPAGTIIAQSPPGGTLVLPGSTVTLTVSSGPADDVTGGWGTWRDYSHLRKKRKPVEEVQEAPETVPEAPAQEAAPVVAQESRATILAKKRSEQVLAELKAIYAEQDALAFQIAFARARMEIEDDDMLLLLAMM